MKSSRSSTHTPMLPAYNSIDRTQSAPPLPISATNAFENEFEYDQTPRRCFSASGLELLEVPKMQLETQKPTEAKIRARSNSSTMSFNFEDIPRRRFNSTESMSRILDLPTISFSEVDTVALAMDANDAKKINRCTRANPLMESYVRELLYARCKNMRNSSNVGETVKLITDLELSPMSCSLLLSGELHHQFKTALGYKLLSADQKALLEIDRAFHIRESIKKSKDTNLRAQLNNKLQVNTKEFKLEGILTYVFAHHMHDLPMLREVVQSIISVYARAQAAFTAPMFLMPQRDSEGRNFIHVLLDMDPSKCEQILQVLNIIFTHDDEHNTQFSHHFATAILLKNDNGLSPLAILARKDAQWTNIREFLLDQVILLLQKFVAVGSESWGKLFNTFGDAYNNSEPDNELMDLFNKEEYAELCAVVESRTSMRTRIYNACNSAMESAKKKSGKPAQIIKQSDLRSIIGMYDYVESVSEIGKPLLYLLGKRVYEYFAQEAICGNSATQMKIAQLKILEDSNSFVLAMRFFPPTGLYPWEGLCNAISEEPDSSIVEDWYAIFSQQVVQNKMDISLLDSNTSVPLIQAALTLQHLSLVNKLCVDHKAHVPFNLLIATATVKRCVEKGIFQFLCKRYIEQRQLTNPGQELSGMNDEGHDLFTCMVFGAKSAAGLRWLLDLGCVPKNVYDHDRDNLLARLLQKYMMQEIDEQAALDLINALLERPRIAQLLLQHRCKLGYTPFSILFFAKRTVADDAIIKLIPRFVAAGAAVQDTFTLSVSVLHVAVLNASPEIFRCLLETARKNLSGADFTRFLNVQNGGKTTALEEAMFYKRNMVPTMPNKDAAGKLMDAKIAILHEFGSAPARDQILAQSSLLYKNVVVTAGSKVVPRLDS